MNLGGEIVEHAKRMLVITSGPSGADMERIWGPGDGRPVEEMKQAVDHLLLEYLSSADLAEACRCIKELNAPEFMHEIVKRAISCVLAKGDASQQAICNLFIYMIEQDILTKQQTIKGFHRLYDRLDDLILDVPTAGATLAMYSAWAIEENILPADFKFNKE
jgi:programmed cell death protein 4